MSQVKEGGMKVWRSSDLGFEALIGGRETDRERERDGNGVLREPNIECYKMEGPATGHIGTGFSWFPCVYKQMLRWFPTLQVATACF